MPAAFVVWDVIVAFDVAFIVVGVMLFVLSAFKEADYSQ
jgi:hypothetical protein